MLSDRQSWLERLSEGQASEKSFPQLCNGLAKVLHFYDYLSFEEDLALKLHNLKFPVLKDVLYQVWLKLAS